MIKGFTSYIVSMKLPCGKTISVESATEADAIAELEEEARFSSSDSNQGASFDEDEEDYYA